LHLKISKFVSLHQKHLKQKLKIIFTNEWNEQNRKSFNLNMVVFNKMQPTCSFQSTGTTLTKLLPVKIYFAQMTIIGTMLS